MPTVRNPYVAAVAIVAIAGLEAVALMRDVDGTLLAAVTAIIAGIAGYAVQPPRHG